MHEFDPGTPTTRQRIVAAIVMIGVAVPALSYWGGWHWFEHDKQVLAASTIVGLIWWAKFAPRVRKDDGNDS
jgi:hypothetical protein